MKNLSYHTDIFQVTNLIANKVDPDGRYVQTWLVDQIG
jgi:hypothetical protein